MITLGVILLVLGLIFQIQVLWIIGIILLVVGAALWVLGAIGRLSPADGITGEARRVYSVPCR